MIVLDTLGHKKVEMAEAMEVTSKLIEDIKKEQIVLIDNDMVLQTLMLDKNKNIVLREEEKEYTHKKKDVDVYKRLNGILDVYLRENDILIKTDNGYQLNQLPIKKLTDEEVELVNKFNELV